MSLHETARSKPEIKGLSDDFSRCGVGIVHFGVGAFHRAHQAVYTHDVLAKHGGNWRILGASLQSTQTADMLNDQNGEFSVLIRGDPNVLHRIKSLESVEAARRSTDRIFEYLQSPDTHIVSMTVTEKAYGIMRETGDVDLQHEGIAHDLANPDRPKGILGMIVKGLKLRKEAGLLPFTVLCCDNLPQNGTLVRKGILDFSRRVGDHALKRWIRQQGAFPNTMVDRITPATPSDLGEEIDSTFGIVDFAPIETETFSQWVIENKFASERPKWEDVGVLFVDDVEPYEQMKLRMLNGAHSLIAYSGFMLGYTYVRDVMANGVLAGRVKTHMHAAARTLKPLKNFNFEIYANQLLERFRNPNIAHETYQIAMDGSQKMPQRIFEPAQEALRMGEAIEPFAFATAAWLRFCSGEKYGQRFALRDPREAELLKAFQTGGSDPEKICKAFLALPELFPRELAESKEWQTTLARSLALISSQGFRDAAAKTD